MGDGRILERTCKVPVIDTNEIHFIEIMTTINTLLGVASSIQAFYLPSEEPLPIGRFFFFSFFWRVGKFTALQLWVHIIIFYDLYISIYLLWSILVWFRKQEQLKWEILVVASFVNDNLISSFFFL